MQDACTKVNDILKWAQYGGLNHTILGKRLTWQGQPRTYKKRVKMPAAIQSDQFMGKNSSCKAPAAK